MQITGWSMEEIDATEAQTLDWLLAIDATITRVEKDEAKSK